jgi:hypothetical protein
MEYPQIERPTDALRWAIENLASMIDARRCMIDADAPPLLRAAARQLAIAGSDARRWTVAKDGTRTLAGLDPEVGRAFDRLADRIEGKPTQSMTIERREARTPAECAAALSALLAAHPRLADALAPRIADLARIAAPHAATDALPIIDAAPATASAHAGSDRGGAPQRDAQGGGDAHSLFRANPESKSPLGSAPQPPALCSPSPHDDWDSDAGRAAAISAAAPEEDAEAGTELGIGPKAFAFAPGPAELPKLGPKARAKRDREYRVRVKAAGTEF